MTRGVETRAKTAVTNKEDYVLLRALEMNE